MNEGYPSMLPMNLPLPAKSRLLAVVAVWLAAALVLAQAPRVQAGGPRYGFVVKLSLGSDPNVLAPVSDGQVTERFSWSADPKFSGVYSITSRFTAEQIARSLGNALVYVEPEHPILSSQVFVTDPEFGGNPRNIDKQWGLVKAGFPAAWERTIGSYSNVVAIIDTGVDTTHQDLRSVTYAAGYDFLARQQITAGSNSDDNGHGTLITGILAATANNGVGIAGANWQVTIMPIKALNSKGEGQAATVAEAIVWAVDHGANFINLSLGGIGFAHDTTLSSAVSYAFSKNAVIVAAAGNDSVSGAKDLDREPVFPICNDNDANMVIGVSAVDVNDIKPEFANYGKSCIDVVAPGKRILSTIGRDPITGSPTPNSYAYGSGTSLAVPFVVGQAALLKTLYPQATNRQIRDMILQSTDPVDSQNLSQCNGSCRGLLGSGRINVARSLERPTPSPVLAAEGELVRAAGGSVTYQVVGGQRRPVSPFVFNQRFLGQAVREVSQAEIDRVPQGAYATPLDGTLVKREGDPTVYAVVKGLKRPVTASVFKLRGFRYSDINVVSYPELESWVTGNFLLPPDGALVKAGRSRTVYWTVGEAVHPITAEFYRRRGLAAFPVTVVPDSDLRSYPIGEPFTS